MFNSLIKMILRPKYEINNTFLNSMYVCIRAAISLVELCKYGKHTTTKTKESQMLIFECFTFNK